MGTKERREREKEKLRNAILDAANDLFVENGYDQTKMRMIAERIEYNVATIYSYYRNKEEIFSALQERAFIAFHAAIGVTVMQYPEPVKRLKEMGRAYIKFALENPLYYDLMFIMREPMNCLKTEEQWERGHQTFEFLKNTVQECMRMGALPKGDPESTALMIWSAMHGLVSLPVRGRMLMFEGKDIHQLIYSAFEEFDKMLTALHRLESKQ